jgi:hypothetical protein
MLAVGYRYAAVGVFFSPTARIKGTLNSERKTLQMPSSEQNL